MRNLRARKSPKTLSASSEMVNGLRAMNIGTLHFRIEMTRR